uniref:Transmembrane protein n=1 Tax=Rhizophora mucronata TaxID=61149 RepID=A0A2P2JPQ4_RHIMU
MMDRRVLRERDLDIDLESGGTTSEKDTTSDIVPANRQTNKLVAMFWNGLLSLDGLVSSSKSGQVSDDNVGLLINKNLEGKEDQLQLTFWNRMHGEEKRKKKNSKKPPKPPRPPNGPSLDAADQKLVKEIAELATRKRARIEQIKALKKMRASKASSWNSSLSAMVITVLFCLIVIFHGFCSRNGGSVLSRSSPKPAFPGTEDLISIQVYNLSANEGSSDDLHSGSSSLAERHVSGSGLRKK